MYGSLIPKSSLNYRDNIYNLAQMYTLAQCFGTHHHFAQGDPRSLLLCGGSVH